MNILIIHAHPEPSSFNSALTAIAGETLEKAGHRVLISDLNAIHFDPVERAAHYKAPENPSRFSPLAEQRHASRTGALPEDIREQIDRLQQADLVILQFPLWWHGPPAILKGWFDRVFVNGGLYSSGKRYDRGHFRGRRAICSVTTGAPAEAFGPGARGGDMATMLWPVQYSLHYMGFTVLPPFVAHGVQGTGYAYREADSLARHLDDLKGRWTDRLRTLDAMPPLAFPGWADWDAAGRVLTRAEAARCA